MKKALRCFIPLVLGLLLGAGMAAAGDLSSIVPQPAVAAPVCEAPVPAVADASQAPAAADLFAPEPQPAAICPLIGCVNDEYCRRDRDCTTRPGGVCNLFCPTRGCCSYPG
ncbi:MAG TPA: hypothetical protein VGG03_21000 [Thermoanaerobaculia bacterium]|jgi:hypothetical protein